ncbi:hypothetical protein ABT404_11520 [Streptomyces hyaluromycini]|uniref:Uncharacterized protein n=1 Tax=Streptomyces hyaluromycini TaxID=1377993 RepID=A0ABV1WTL0_9ACTN
MVVLTRRTGVVARAIGLPGYRDLEQFIFRHILLPCGLFYLGRFNAYFPKWADFALWRPCPPIDPDARRFTGSRPFPALGFFFANYLLVYLWRRRI